LDPTTTYRRESFFFLYVMMVQIFRQLFVEFRRNVQTQAKYSKIKT